MKQIKLGIILLMIGLFGSIQHSMAQRISAPKSGTSGTWRVIAKTTAHAGVDHDVVRVTGADNFRKLKLKVTDSGLNMIRMIVTYDGGGVQKIALKQYIPKNGESRIIDLNGGSRSIRTIEYWYEDTGFLNGRADLTVYGRK